MNTPFAGVDPPGMDTKHKKAICEVCELNKNIIIGLFNGTVLDREFKEQFLKLETVKPIQP